MDALKSYLPPGDGFMPKYLFFLAIVSMGNSLQAYSTMHYTAQVYLGSSATGNKSPATPLSGRTFGTYTFITALVRLYASWHIREPAWYDLATWTFAIAGFHFFSEWLYFGTTRWNKGLAGPIVVASVSLPWMIIQRAHYVG